MRTFLEEQENLGFLKRNDPNTEIIELAYPIARKIDQMLPFQKLETAIMMNEGQKTLMIFYFNGDSYLSAGKIMANLGVGPYRLENRMDAFCNGASNLTIWAIWDCSRQV